MPYPFPRPPRYRLKVRRGSSGLGLFADEDIPRGRFLIEYWGKLLNDEQAETVGGRYLFDLENGRTIEGSARKNIARYANHACRPNSEMRVVGNRAFVYSVKRIRAGQEITYDYGDEYVACYIKPHGCRCASCLKKKLVV